MPARAVGSLLGVKPVDAKVLARKRGGADVINDMQLKGVVADNRAINVTTGSNVITEGAFAEHDGPADGRPELGQQRPDPERDDRQRPGEVTADAMKKMWATLAVALGGLCVHSAEAGSIELPVQIGGAFSVPAVSHQGGPLQRHDPPAVRLQLRLGCAVDAAHLSLSVPGQRADSVRGDVRAGRPGKDQARGLFAARHEALPGIARLSRPTASRRPLDKLASAGIPAIVLINEHGYNHFVVIKGMRDERVLIGDPSGGRPRPAAMPGSSRCGSTRSCS